jgi:hypothetical protein
VLEGDSNERRTVLGSGPPATPRIDTPLRITCYVSVGIILPPRCFGLQRGCLRLSPRQTRQNFRERGGQNLRNRRARSYRSLAGVIRGRRSYIPGIASWGFARSVAERPGVVIWRLSGRLARGILLVCSANRSIMSGSRRLKRA